MSYGGRWQRLRSGKVQTAKNIYEIVYIKNGHRQKAHIYANDEKQARILCYIESRADDIISVADVTADV